jgi:hypothetical protein
MLASPPTPAPPSPFPPRAPTQDLFEYPDNVWSLTGLQQALFQGAKVGRGVERPHLVGCAGRAVAGCALSWHPTPPSFPYAVWGREGRSARQGAADVRPAASKGHFFPAAGRLELRWCALSWPPPSSPYAGGGRWGRTCILLILYPALVFLTPPAPPRHPLPHPHTPFWRKAPASSAVYSDVASWSATREARGLDTPVQARAQRLGRARLGRAKGLANVQGRPGGAGSKRAQPPTSPTRMP